MGLTLTEDNQLVDPQELVQKWLIAEEFKVQSIRDPNCWFNFLAEDKSGRKVNVAQVKTKTDLISIGAKLKIEESHIKKLLNMDEHKRNDLFWEIRLGLLDKGVGFSAISMPLKEITISYGVYYDGLTKDRFMNKLFDVRKSLLFVGWVIARALGEPEPSERFSPLV